MKQLNNKEIKQINESLAKYNTSINSKQRVVEDDGIILLDGFPMFAKVGENILPLLKANPALPSIFVDKGAIPFIIKGADLMRPGVASVDNFKKDELVLIVDKEHKKSLAIGIALFDSEEMIKLEKGKVVKIYNYVGDKYWSYKN